MDQLLEHVYLHIENGGVSFLISENAEGRCKLQVAALHLGHKTNGMELLTTPDSLRQIGEAFLRASKHEFPGVPVVNSARAMGELPHDPAPDLMPSAMKLEVSE